MLDSTIPLTVNEYTEWGNPGEKEYYDYMLKYSPYDNVRATAYPNILVTGGLNDPNVQYWEPAKFTAKLRASKPTRTGSCSKPTWAPVTAARPAGMITCGILRSNMPLFWTSWE